jgi:hypothetical protein
MFDLEECIVALENRDIESNEEQMKAKDMLVTFLEFCENEGIIVGYNNDVITDIIRECE